MVGSLSPQEVAFWICLFGLDLGVPMLISERWQMKAGALATALSLVGLVWSVGFRPSLPEHVGWLAALVFVGVGTGTMVLLWRYRSRRLPLETRDAIEGIKDYLQRIGSDYGGQIETLHDDPERWSAIIHRYKRQYGSPAANLAKEIASPDSTEVANLLKEPKSVQSIRDAVFRFEQLANEVDRYAFLRLTGNCVFGALVGLIAYFLVYLVAKVL